MGALSFLFLLVGPYGSYSSFYVWMDSNVSLRVLIGPYLLIWILMGLYGFL